MEGLFDILIPAFIFLLAISFMVGIFLYTLHSTKKDKELRIKLARELGLEYTEEKTFPQEKIQKFPKLVSTLLTHFTPWKIKGHLHGVALEIFQVTKGSGKNQTIYTVIQHNANIHLPISLELTRQGFLEGFFVKTLNLQDIQIGRKEFDDKFRIKGSDEKSITILLNNLALQKSLMELHSLNGNLLITQELISFHIVGLIREPKVFQDYARKIANSSHLLYGSGSGYNPFG
jgi:hypothetical protein